MFRPSCSPYASIEVIRKSIDLPSHSIYFRWPPLNCPCLRSFNPRVETDGGAQGSDKEEGSKVCTTVRNAGGGGSRGSEVLAGAETVDVTDDPLATSVGKVRHTTYHVLAAILASSPYPPGFLNILRHALPQTVGLDFVLLMRCVVERGWPPSRLVEL